MGCPTDENAALKKSNESPGASVPHYEEKEVLPTSSQRCHQAERHVAFQTPLPSTGRDVDAAAHRQRQAEDQGNNPPPATIPDIHRNAAYPVWLAPLPRHQTRGGRAAGNPSSTARTAEVARPLASAGGIPTTADLRAALMNTPGSNDRESTGEATAPMKDGEQKREFLLQQSLKASQKEIANLRQVNLALKEHLKRLLGTSLLPGSEDTGGVDSRRKDTRGLDSHTPTTPGLNGLQASNARMNAQLASFQKEIENLKIELNKSRSQLDHRESELALKHEEMSKARADHESIVNQERLKVDDAEKASTKALQIARNATDAKVEELSKKLNRDLRVKEQDIERLKEMHRQELNAKEKELKQHYGKTVGELALKDMEISGLTSYINAMEQKDAADTADKYIETSIKTKALNDLKKRVVEMREELECIIEEKEELQEDLTTMSKENEQLQESLKTRSQLLTRATAELKRKHEELGERSPDLDRKTKELKAKDEELKRQLEVTKWYKNQSDCYKSQLDSSQREIETKTSQITQLFSKTNEMDLEVLELNNKSSLLLKRLKAAEQENETLKGRIAILRRNNSAAQNQKAAFIVNDALSMAGAAGSQPDSDITSQESEEDSGVTDDGEYDHVEESVSGDELYTLV